MRPHPREVLTKHPFEELGISQRADLPVGMLVQDIGDDERFHPREVVDDK